MSDKVEELKCLRCGSQMTLDPQWYTVPRLKPRNPPTDNTTVSVENGRMVRLYLCGKCHYLELRVPDGWPDVSPVQG